MSRPNKDRWSRVAYRSVWAVFLLASFGSALTAALTALAAMDGPLERGRWLLFGAVILLLALSTVALPLLMTWDERRGREAIAGRDRARAARSGDPREGFPPPIELVQRFTFGTALAFLLVLWQHEVWWFLPVYLALWLAYAAWWAWGVRSGRPTRGAAN